VIDENRWHIWIQHPKNSKDPLENLTQEKLCCPDCLSARPESHLTLELWLDSESYMTWKWFDSILRDLTPNFRDLSYDFCLALFNKGPSIYGVSTEGEGDRLRWTHVDGGGDQSPCGRPHKRLKLESTDVILFFSCKEVGVFFLPEFCLWTE